MTTIDSVPSRGRGSASGDSTRNSFAQEYLGDRIKRLRTERGMSQDRLAIEAHVDQSGLSKFERGKNRQFAAAGVQRIAAVLRIPYEDLVRGTQK